jgi:hypothetical protein
MYIPGSHGSQQVSTRPLQRNTAFLVLLVDIRTFKELFKAEIRDDKANERTRLGPEVIVAEPFHVTLLQCGKISAQAKDGNGVTETEIYIGGELEASTLSYTISVLWYGNASLAPSLLRVRRTRPSQPGRAA